MNNQRVGVIVGRFQTSELTEGHIELIDQVIHENDLIIIFIGTSVVLDSARNPLDYRTREIMVGAHINREYDVAYHSEISILPLPDAHCDEVWSKELDKRIREVDAHAKVTLYGGRDSFIPHYTGHFETKTVALVDSVPATDIREAIASSPLTTADFRAGVIYAKANQWPKVHATVDIAILTHCGGYTNILLGRKPSENKWRLPGGFVDPTDEGFEATCAREMLEETNIQMDKGSFVNVRSFLMTDWRYAQERNKVITSLFTVEVPTSVKPEAGDDLAELRWFKLKDLSVSLCDVMPVHHVLVKAVINWLE